jgi:hypothetical protein
MKDSPHKILKFSRGKVQRIFSRIEMTRELDRVKHRLRFRTNLFIGVMICTSLAIGVYGYDRLDSQLTITWQKK